MLCLPCSEVQWLTVHIYLRARHGYTAHFGTTLNSCLTLPCIVLLAPGLCCTTDWKESRGGDQGRRPDLQGVRCSTLRRSVSVRAAAFLLSVQQQRVGSCSKPFVFHPHVAWESPHYSTWSNSKNLASALVVAYRPATTASGRRQRSLTCACRCSCLCMQALSLAP
jgi:hypothetical protein